VLRLKEGDTVELFNGRGLSGRAEVLGFDEGFTFLRAVAWDEAPEPSPRVTVASAVPKGPKADDMVAMLSQAGADVFVPMVCAWSVVDPRAGKVERFAKLSAESAKQCGRSWLMQVAEPTELGKVLMGPKDVGLGMDPDAEPIGDLPEQLRGAANVTILVGPEGGLTPEELRACDNAGFTRWRVGGQVLRIETAAAVGVGVLRYLAG